MIHVICKMLRLLKNHLNYLKDNIFKCIFEKYNKRFFFFNWFLSKCIIKESLTPEEENIIKDKRNLLRLKNEQNYSAVKNINLFMLKNKLKEWKI